MMKTTDKVLLTAIALTSTALMMVVYLDHRCAGEDFDAQLTQMKAYTEETGLEMQDVELVIVDGPLTNYPPDSPKAYLNDAIMGLSYYYGDHGKIKLRSPSTTAILAHEYAHQIMDRKGYADGHHEMTEFNLWSNCLYASVALDMNVCEDMSFVRDMILEGANDEKT